MGSHRKRRKLATVQKDRLDFESVSGKTIDENQAFIRWMVTGACIGDDATVQNGRNGVGSLIENLELSLLQIKAEFSHFSTCGIYQPQQAPNVEYARTLVYTLKDAVIE